MNKTRLLSWLPIVATVAVPVVWPTPMALVLGLALGVLVHQGLLWLARRFPSLGHVLPAAHGREAWDLASHAPHRGLFSGHATDEDRWIEDSISEFVMGGPLVATALLADGMLIDSADLSAPILSAHDAQGPCRALLCQSRRGHWIVVADLATHMHCRVQDTDALSATALFEQWRALGPAARAMALRQQLNAAPALESTVPWRGLRLAPRDLEPDAQLDAVDRRLPSGRRLHARSLLPADLRAARNPAMWVRWAPCALWVDERPTPHHVTDLEDVWESADGSVLVVHGVQISPSGRCGGALFHMAFIRAGRPWVWRTVAAHSDPDRHQSPWFLTAPDPRNDGQVGFTLHRESDDGSPPARPPAVITLPARGFAQAALQLRVHEYRVLIALPPAS